MNYQILLIAKRLVLKYCQTLCHLLAPLEISLGKIKESLLKSPLICKQQSYFLNFDTTEISYEIKSGYSILYLGRQYKLVVENLRRKTSPTKEICFNYSKNKEKAQMFFDEWLKQRAYCKISEIAKPIIKIFRTLQGSE